MRKKTTEIRAELVALKLSGVLVSSQDKYQRHYWSIKPVKVSPLKKALPKKTPGVHTQVSIVAAHAAAHFGLTATQIATATGIPSGIAAASLHTAALCGLVQRYRSSDSILNRWGAPVRDVALQDMLDKGLFPFEIYDVSEGATTRSETSDGRFIDHLSHSSSSADKISAFLRTTTEPQTVDQIAKATLLASDFISRIMTGMVSSGVAVKTTNASRRAIYAMADVNQTGEIAAVAPPKPAPVTATASPKAKRVLVEAPPKPAPVIDVEPPKVELVEAPPKSAPVIDVEPPKVELVEEPIEQIAAKDQIIIVAATSVEPVSPPQKASGSWIDRVRAAFS